MTGAELRALLEAHWAENAGRTLADMLEDAGVPTEVARLGAERVHAKGDHWSTGEPPDHALGFAWIDGFIAGAHFASDGV